MRCEGNEENLMHCNSDGLGVAHCDEVNIFFAIILFYRINVFLSHVLEKTLI